MKDAHFSWGACAARFLLWGALRRFPKTELWWIVWNRNDLQTKKIVFLCNLSTCMTIYVRSHMGGRVHTYMDGWVDGWTDRQMARQTDISKKGRREREDNEVMPIMFWSQLVLHYKSQIMQCNILPQSQHICNLKLQMGRLFTSRNKHTLWIWALCIHPINCSTLTNTNIANHLKEKGEIKQQGSEQETGQFSFVL